MKKKITIIIIILIAAASVWYFFIKAAENEIGSFTFVKIERGDLVSKITSSGTLQAVSKIEVGTQVSGRIVKMYVDFNDNVKKGQMLALLDTTFLSASVRDAQATLAKAKAQLNEAVNKHERNQKLFKQDYISELDYIISETGVTTAKAAVQSAESSLERANTNLKYAFIRSPIDGTVIARNVEAGQTVAASLQAPTLFNIAEDLSNMEILAEVDESDIGLIKNGQKVKFTVQAYSDKEFDGYVRQIRLQPQTIQNVVNYTVVINADNKSGILLPGMTATIDFYVEQNNDVLLVPQAALRFKPPEKLYAEFIKDMESKRNSGSDSSGRRRSFRRGNSSFGGGSQFTFNNSNSKRTFGQLWTLDENKKLKMLRVVVGTSDGKVTEIIRGRNIKEGMEVISGYNSNSKTNITLPHRFRRGF